MSATDNGSTPLGGKQKKSLDSVVIRFAGDSGDGMQVTGAQFTTTSALVGNDLATLPDYPAEIRAPAGTTGGVSGYQIQISNHDIYTPGDHPHTLVAMNPAALKVNLRDLEPGATVILNIDAFTEKDIERAGFKESPLTSGALKDFTVLPVKISTMTLAALESSSLSKKDKDRCKNFFALGLIYWMYGRPLEHSLAWISKKFGKKPDVVEANSLALQAGWAYGETTEVFDTRYDVSAAKDVREGVYRRVTGNEATALGFIAAAHMAGLELFLGSYPITPASDILHNLSRYKHYGVRTFQAEDEIAAVASAIGASFGGLLGLTTTSGPGVALKGEAIGLACMVELPLVIVNVQRGGPSTGLPTKTEQSDLFQAVFGRNGDAPVPVLAAATPGDCFWMAVEATRIATKFMTPVFLLTDGYIANGAEPWRVPEVESLPHFDVQFWTDVESFAPYRREEVTLARPWVRPGTPGLEHRVGGLEKEDITGDVSYDGENHERMSHLRAEKLERIARDIADAEVHGAEEGELLVVSWGGTYGSVRAGVELAQQEGLSVTHLHLRHIHPMPANVGRLMRSFRRVLVAELNMGQLHFVLRGKFLRECELLSKVQGKPFRVREVLDRIHAVLEVSSSAPHHA